MSGRRTLVVGIGSHHGDDQAGWLVADALSDRACPSCEVRKVASPIEILDWLEGLERLILCDACRGLGEVGETYHTVWPTTQITAVNWSGTHDLGLPTVLELAERLGNLPPEVHIWGIEASADAGLHHVHPDVHQAVTHIAAAIAALM